MSRLNAVRTGRHALLLALLASAAPAFAQDDDPPPTPAETPADPPATAGAPARAAGRAQLHARRFRPLQSAQRARHAEPGAGLFDRDLGHRPPRPRPGDGQRADQRRALHREIDRHLHRASPDQHRQRHPDRDRRRRDAEHFRPDRPGRQHHHSQSGPQRQFRLSPADPRPAHRGAAAQRRDLDQRLARPGDPILAELPQRQLPQRQCRAGARHHARRRPCSTGATRRSTSMAISRGSAARSAAISATARCSTPTPPCNITRSTSTRSRSAPGPGQPDRDRRLHEQEREWNYELGGDYEFGLGGGRLKLIGLRRFEHSPFSQTLIQSFADGSPTQGQRFTQVADETETILRGEYRWRGGNADWQVSLEGALNRLDIENGLFERNAAGDFVPVPFPNSAATVEERRAEAILTYGRPLSSNLTLQVSAGGEYSELSQSGAGGLTRTFYRPKGFLNLAWRPPRRARHQRPDRARRRPAQLLRFRRLGQCQRRHPECRQRQSGAAAKLERAAPGDPQSRPLGHGDGAALRAADPGHRRRHPDRRQRPVAGQSRGHRLRLRPAMDQHLQPRSARLARRQGRHEPAIPAHPAHRSADRRSAGRSTRT